MLSDWESVRVLKIWDECDGAGMQAIPNIGAHNWQRQKSSESGLLA